MNNSYAMAATLESKKESQQAAMITTGFAVLMLLLMFLWKWPLPKLEKPLSFSGIEVELNLPEEPETIAEGGGGGGNPVQAAGPAGEAPPVPPAPGDEDDSKDIADKDDVAPITKPVVTKPEAKKVTNTSTAKTEPRPVVENPAPPKPKAVLGKTTTGSGKGGGAADDYEKSGGTGTGAGVGNGSGAGGGSGTGSGGGTGSGSGGGSGPKITRGDRKIVRHYSFEGDLEKAVVYANVSVSPEGIGKLVSIAKGSTQTSNAYKEAIIRYLQNIRFDKADHESMVTVQFNFRVN